MPHYGLNTQLNEKDMAKLKLAKAKVNESTYKFLRVAVCERCERILKENGNIEQGKPTENGSSAESGRQETIALDY